MAVAAFTGQVIFQAAIRVLLAAEGHAALDEPADRLRSLAHHKFHRVAVAQAGAGIEGILDMRLEAVFLAVQHRGHAALGVEA